MTEDVIINTFSSLLHTRKVWGAASVTMEKLNCSWCGMLPTSAGTNIRDVCRCDELKLPKRRTLMSRCQKHHSEGCCWATWFPSAEPIVSLLINSTGNNQHQQKTLKAPVLPLPSLSLQLRSHVSSTCPLMLETHWLSWSMQGQHCGLGTAVPCDSPAGSHHRVKIVCEWCPGHQIFSRNIFYPATLWLAMWQQIIYQCDSPLKYKTQPSSVSFCRFSLRILKKKSFCRIYIQNLIEKVWRE